MKIHLFFVLLSFTVSVSEGFSQVDKNDHSITNVYHYRSNVSLKNIDGTRSIIKVNSNSATLSNSDGTQSILEVFGRFASLIAIDGNVSSVSYGSISSTIHNIDGTRLVINHRKNSSTCSTVYGKHTINHSFGSTEEWPNKNAIDILIHMNWYMQMQALDEMEELTEVEPMN